ncbi:hypothetical protein [Guptibacillus spartinae]|uniref:hypothetical protein n=1 Tax=Guptibacillus spartinae TaxID=3025679 RepID=UPI00235FAFED|nr:hypothetical protein [Pseudalkalibacillus spartinae]
MSIFLALLPLLFWIGVAVAIIYFIVRKVKRSRRALEERIEVLEKNQAAVKEKSEF